MPPPISREKLVSLDCGFRTPGFMGFVHTQEFDHDLIKMALAMYQAHDEVVRLEEQLELATLCLEAIRTSASAEHVVEKATKTLETIKALKESK